jgi:hypothetical protein
LITTGDASSPVEDSRAMAASLEEGHLIVIDAVKFRVFWSVGVC